MRHICKRIASLVLVLAALAAFFVPSALAAETAADRQRAVVETALAYYYRGMAVQYDSNPITVMGKYTELEGDIRSTDFTSPEMATAQDTMYSVCSAFCFEVYFDVLNYQIGGAPITSKVKDIIHMEADDPIVVYKWDSTRDASKTKETVISEALAVIRPGDVIATIDASESAGHAMLYAGDVYGDGSKYIIHCWGSKYNMDTGADKVEGVQNGAPEGGAIRMEDAIAGCFTTTKTKGVGCPVSDKLTIIRPLNTGLPLTDNAKARLNYSHLEIDRQADHNKYYTVEEGGDITVTLELTNNSAKAYTVPVTEIVPANAALKDAGGASVSGNTLTWRVELKPKAPVTISYTVTATGKRGETIDLTGGSVGGIKANSIPVKIGGKQFSEEQQAKLKNITSQRAAFSGKTYSDTAFAEAIYENILGISVDIPTASELLKNLYTRQKLEGATTLMFVSNGEVPSGFETKAAMQVPYYFGGQLVRTGGGGSRDRILDFHDYQLQPGDVIVCYYLGKSSTVYVYIGDGKVAYMDGTTLKTQSSSVLTKNLIYDYFVCLRPTLAYDDISVMKVLPFTDVNKNDWYYSYVQALVNDGTVSGMTPTTFVPGGNLTYGQALKLIALAVGEGEQAASSSHWAGGYLALAKAKGWLSADVDLNANITRLELCKIAAAAKGLTQQPASNPFRDCSDPSVLALVNAGVINGMTENTFQPNGLLTRAQITKIIWGMNQV